MGHVAKKKKPKPTHREVVVHAEDPARETMRHLVFDKKLAEWPGPDPDLAPVDVAVVLRELRIHWAWFDGTRMLMPANFVELAAHDRVEGSEILTVAEAYLNLYRKPPTDAKLAAALEAKKEAPLSDEALYYVVGYILEHHQP